MDSTKKLWTRSPSNLFKSVGGAAGGYVRELGPDGSTVHMYNTTLYYVGASTTVSTDIGYDRGRVMWVGTTPYKLIFNGVFRVNP
jgi:hypothetical protein